MDGAWTMERSDDGMVTPSFGRQIDFDDRALHGQRSDTMKYEARQYVHGLLFLLLL